MIPYTLTSNTLIFIDLDGTPKQVSKTHHNFEEAKQLVIGAVKTPIMEVYTKLDELLKPISKLKKIVKSNKAYLSVDEVGQVTYTKGAITAKVPLSLSQYILKLYEENGDIQPYLKFMGKLIRNPNPEIFNQMWAFIQECGMCLTNNGNFLAYKNVNKDFTSIYDGKTDNTPGTVLRMDRKSVEYDPDNTCSSGLHFAAWGYLQHYSFGGKTVIVSVNPKDVVSIPTDYNHQKGRACKYKIIREVTQPEELKRQAVYTLDSVCENCGQPISDEPEINCENCGYPGYFC